MIRRKSLKDGHQYQSLNEDSFTNKKGIDVTQAPPMRDFVFDAENLDVNLDGSMSLRKPLYVFHKVESFYTKESYNNVNYFYITNLDDNTPIKVLKIGPESDWQIKLKYKDIYYGDYDSTEMENIDLSNVTIVNTNNSSVLCNAVVNLDEAMGSSIPHPYKDSDFIVNAYFRITLDANVKIAILEYIEPYIPNLIGSETELSFNPNTAGYYTYAVKDTYNQTINQVNNILAYSIETPLDNTIKVQDITEYNSKSINYIIQSFSKDFSSSILLKAFCDFNTNTDLYCLWEKTNDGVNYEDCLTNYSTEKLLIPSQYILENKEESVVYEAKNVIPLNDKIYSELDSYIRPDIFKIETFDVKSSYRFTLYGKYKNPGVLTDRNIVKLNNCLLTDSSWSQEDIPVRYFYTDTDYLNELNNHNFEIKYNADLDFDITTLQIEFKYKNTTGNVLTVQVIKTITEERFADYKTITIIGDVTTTTDSLDSTNDICNIKQCAIRITSGATQMDIVKYNVIDVYELPSPQSDNYIHIIGDSTTFSMSENIKGYIDFNTLEPTFNNHNVCLLYDNNSSAEMLYNITQRQLGYAMIYPHVSQDATVVYDGNVVNFEEALDIAKAMLDNPDYLPSADTKVVRIIINDTGNITQYLYRWLSTESHSRLDLVWDLNRGQVPNRGAWIVRYEVRHPKFILFGNKKYYMSRVEYTYSPSNYLSNLQLKNCYTNVITNANEITFTSSGIDYGYVISSKTYSPLITDITEKLNEDFVNTVKGNKLYYNYKLYSYGDDSFKNNIYVSNSNSFETPLLNTISLPMSDESKVTALVPWRDYLISASKNSLFLITPQGGNNYTTKIINTFIGIPEKDSKTLKSILNGVIFKSGSKIYTVQPNVYSGDESILNVIDISKPIAPYIVDTADNNFAFTTEQFYYLCIPDTANSTTKVLKYEYATRIWTKHSYPIVFRDVWINTVDDIKIITNEGIFYFNKDMNDIRKNLGDSHPAQVQYGDIIDNMYVSPFNFSLDTGQKSYSMNLVKQFVESKFIFSIDDKNEALPLSIDVYADQFNLITHKDVNTSNAFWKELDSSMLLGTSFSAVSETPTENNIKHPVIKQLFLRYSGKGFTIRHVISSKSFSQFKFYVSYYRYKSTINKH